LNYEFFFNLLLLQLTDSKNVLSDSEDPECLFVVVTSKFLNIQTSHTGNYRVEISPSDAEQAYKFSLEVIGAYSFVTTG